MDDSKKLNLPSLRNILLRRMTLLTIVFAIVTSFLIGFLAFQEAKEQQDELLAEIANLVKLQQYSGMNDDHLWKTSNKNESIVILDVGSEESKEFYLEIDKLEIGYHSLKIGEENWRVFIFSGPGKFNFCIGQKTDERDENALGTCLSFLIPVLLLLALLTLLVNFNLKSYFKKLEILGQGLSLKKPGDMSKLKLDGIFIELIPFFDAINSLIEKCNAYIEGQKLFIANAAHELRTPVAAITLQLENFLKSEDEREKRDRQQYILDSLAHFKKKLEQLLDVARLEGPPQSPLEKTSFLSLIRDIVSEQFPLIEKKNVNIEVKCLADVFIDTIPGEIDCLVKNAIENALKFSKGEDEIIISLSEKENRAIFVVENICESVSETQLPRLCETFFRVNKNRGGSGLGLSICKKIAERMGGEMNLEITSDHIFRFIYSQEISKN